MAVNCIKINRSDQLRNKARQSRRHLLPAVFARCCLSQHIKEEGKKQRFTHTDLASRYAKAAPHMLIQ